MMLKASCGPKEAGDRFNPLTLTPIPANSLRLNCLTFVARLLAFSALMIASPLKSIAIEVTDDFADSFDGSAEWAYGEITAFPQYFGLNTTAEGQSLPSEKWKSEFKRALEAWDYWLCFDDDLRYDETVNGRITVQWRDDNYFNTKIFPSKPAPAGRHYTGAFVPLGATKVDPSVLKNEIYFNSSYSWDWDTQEGLDSFYRTALHEIGHSLGIRGDWGTRKDKDGNPIPPPPGKSKDEIMWGKKNATQTGLRPSDIADLSGVNLDYANRVSQHVPGPLPIFGVGAAFRYTRKLRSLIGKSRHLSYT